MIQHLLDPWRTATPRQLIGPRRQMASQRTPGFSSTVFRKKFRAGMTVRNYRDNEAVFSQGDPAEAEFYIQSGTVKLTAAATRRKKAIMAVLLAGSSCGERCIGGPSLRIFSART